MMRNGEERQEPLTLSATVTHRKPMARRVVLCGAASAIGIRPYDDTPLPRRLDLAPAVLRDAGLAVRFGAHDIGDVSSPPYRDFVRPAGRVRNEAELVRYSAQVAARVSGALGDGAFVLLLGGDCSIVLGALLGAREARRRVGLAYLDAHADFATPAESYTGSAASMCLAMAVGRGDSPLARLRADGPLVCGEDVVLIGRRDTGAPYYGQDALRGFGILDIPGERLAREGGATAAATALERLGRAELDGFWIHLDADLLDAAIMPAVDSPEPNGPGVEEVAMLLAPLVSHPRALGMQLTIYDPALDPDRVCATRLVTLLESLLT
jgi:arginase